MSLSPTSYRDRIYMIEDIILKLVEHGELNQTALISFCGLNLKKHRCILDELEINGLIQKCESPFGKRTVTVYKPTQKGVEFCRSILEPYERLFPRRKESVANNNNNVAEKPAIKSSRQEQEMEVRQQQKKQQELRLITSKQVIL
ncbi:MAG: winged helix-turn-helix domain-containing protein [Nitrososphaeraceae archaeon]